VEADLKPPSFWLATCGDDLTPRPPLPGDRSADVCIVGAGFTGLWTAYHLTRIDPRLRVVVLEEHVAGWGASGRNGGWLSALFAASWDRVAREHGTEGALRLRRALEATVDDVGKWAVEHGIDIGYAKGGTLTLARDSAQLDRLHRHVDEDRRFGGDDTELLDRERTAERIRVTGAVASAYTPHCAAIQPAALARGLARVVERQGVTVHESTTVRRISSGRVETDRGVLTADVVVRATEGYTVSLADERRAIAPLWSLIIATEPLPTDVWREIGWDRRETLTDERHVLIYAQRSADDRIVLGGRGAPYRFGSRTTATRVHGRTHQRLEQTLRELFPAARDAAVTHRWGGVLGVPRDWMPSVGFDRRNGLGWGGGYVGDGVGCSALAGATLADLVLGSETDLTSLPWVNHRGRAWEPEPLRWLGIRATAAVLAAADHSEERTGRPSRMAAAAARLLGG